MTVYELISLQSPFEKLCKMNPDVNINFCVIKSQRPTLSIKVNHIILLIDFNCFYNLPSNACLIVFYTHTTSK